jgi:signal transduction histidine kinase
MDFYLRWQLHGGELRVDTKEGKGAEFAIQLIM